MHRNKSNSMSTGKKQQGVVLLTCLVFLLILLAMLRFTLTSAKVEEQKAGIDWEIASARESAQSALSYVEYYILRQGELRCEANGGTQCKQNAASHAYALFTGSSTDLLASNFTDPHDTTLPTIGSLVNNGLYIGADLSAHTAECTPMWVCVNWPQAARAVNDSAQKQRSAGAATRLQAVTCPRCSIRGSIAPVFIIERFTASELGMSGDALVFRVTAVGFGTAAAPTGTAGSAQRVMEETNVTDTMLQATYVIPRG